MNLKNGEHNTNFELFILPTVWRKKENQPHGKFRAGLLRKIKEYVT